MFNDFKHEYDYHQSQVYASKYSGSYENSHFPYQKVKENEKLLEHISFQNEQILNLKHKIIELENIREQLIHKLNEQSVNSTIYDKVNLLQEEVFLIIIKLE